MLAGRRYADEAATIASSPDTMKRIWDKISQEDFSSPGSLSYVWYIYILTLHIYLYYIHLHQHMGRSGYQLQQDFPFFLLPPCQNCRYQICCLVFHTMLKHHMCDIANSASCTRNIDLSFLFFVELPWELPGFFMEDSMYEV